MPDIVSILQNLVPQKILGKLYSLLPGLPVFWGLRNNPWKFIRKLPNYFKSYLSYKFRLSKPLGYPPYLFFEPFGGCNLRCPLCPRGRGEVERKGPMGFDGFQTVMQKAGPYLYGMTFAGTGEPFLNTRIYDMVALARTMGIKTTIYSNFQLPDEPSKIVQSGLDSLIISIDGCDQDTYERYRRGGEFKKTFENIKALSAKKKELKIEYPHIALQYIVMKHNQSEVRRFKKMAEELMVEDVRFKAVYVNPQYTLEDAKDFLPDEQYSMYNIEGSQLKLKTHSGKIRLCDAPWFTLTVLHTGQVVPCCYDTYAELGMGNLLLDKSLSEIWKGKDFIDFRRSLKENKVSLCRECTEQFVDYETDFFFDI